MKKRYKMIWLIFVLFVVFTIIVAMAFYNVGYQKGAINGEKDSEPD